jgi:hypothetical protein
MDTMFSDALFRHRRQCGRAVFLHLNNVPISSIFGIAITLCGTGVIINAFYQLPLRLQRTKISNETKKTEGDNNNSKCN